MLQHSIDGSLGFLLNKGTQTFHRELNRDFQRCSHDITYEQWSVLIFLFHCNGSSQNEIAEQTYRDKVSVTKIIDSLEKRSLVLRKPDDKDRRVNRIFLTDGGKQIVPKLKKIAVDTIKSAFLGAEEKDIGSFRLVLSLIIKNLSGEDILEFINLNKGRWK